MYTVMGSYEDKKQEPWWFLDDNTVLDYDEVQMLWIMFMDDPYNDSKTST